MENYKTLCEQANVEFIDFENNDILDKEIAKSHKTILGVSEKAQAILVSCTLHALKHRDCSKLTDYVSGLPNSINKKNGVQIWITQFTSFKWGKNAQGKEMFLGRSEKGVKEFTFDLKGIETRFYQMAKVEKLNKLMTDDSMFAAIKALIANANKEGVTLSERGQAFITHISATYDEFAPAKPAKV